MWIWCFWRVMSNMWDVLKNTYSVLPFLCEGFRNLLHFFCVPPKARNLALECYYSLFVNGGKTCWFSGRQWSLWVSVTFSCFPALKESVCVQIGIVVLYLLILLCSWEFPAERLPHAWECRSATVGSSAHLCQWRIISLFLMSAIFDDSLSTLPSLKVILVSIFSPSWRCDIC